MLLLISCSSDDTERNETVSEPLELQPASDSELMQRVQEDVFKYFWDYTHPISKLSRERLHENDLSFDANTVTTGGSGFGFLNILMGIEQNIISRAAGISHLLTALNFLENADRFHGAWPHWMDGWYKWIRDSVQFYGQGCRFDRNCLAVSGVDLYS
tara:strand:- start:8171 stop:8641 length:471 start_codon:yes stop_codon:yes gene_type:complete